MLAGVLADVRWVEGAGAALRAARAAGIPTVLDGDTAPLQALQALVFIMRNFVLKTINLVSKMMNSLLQIVNFVLTPGPTG